VEPEAKATLGATASAGPSGLIPEGSMMKNLITAAGMASVLLIPHGVDASEQDKPLEVIVYPILVEAPIFGASIDLPPVLEGIGEAREQNGSTDVSLDAFYMAAVAVRAHRWFAEARGQWADLSASRGTPRVTLDTQARFFTVRGGPTLGKGFSATAGVRRIWGALNATLDVPSIGRTLAGSIDQVLYDPLVGIDWRGRYGALILEGSFSRTLVSSQTLHGPIGGVALAF
jgi:hypothetical protein